MAQSIYVLIPYAGTPAMTFFQPFKLLKASAFSRRAFSLLNLCLRKGPFTEAFRALCSDLGRDLERLPAGTRSTQGILGYLVV